MCSFVCDFNQYKTADCLQTPTLPSKILCIMVTTLTLLFVFLLSKIYPTCSLSLTHMHIYTSIKNYRLQQGTSEEQQALNQKRKCRRHESSQYWRYKPPGLLRTQVVCLCGVESGFIEYLKCIYLKMLNVEVIRQTQSIWSSGQKRSVHK